MHEVLVNRLGGLSLPRESVVRLTDRPDMTLDVYRRRKTTIQPAVLVLFFPCCYRDVDKGSHGLNHTQSLECESKINVKRFISLFYFIYIILSQNPLELKNKFIMLWE